MFLAVLLVAFVVLMFITVSDYKDISAASSKSESLNFDYGGSGLNELALEMSKAFQGSNDTVFYIAIGVTVGIALAIDVLVRRFV